MANVSVNFDKLKDKHPTGDSIKSFVKDIPAFVNETCTVQLSYALNYAGAPILNYAYPDGSLYSGKVRAFQGADGKFYIYAVPDMKVYLNGEFGDAENFKGSKQEMVEKMKGRQGIVAFGHRHIDLWVGDDIQRPRNYLMDVLWNATKIRGVFFWEVTSEDGF